MKKRIVLDRGAKLLENVFGAYAIGASDWNKNGFYSVWNEHEKTNGAKRVVLVVEVYR